MKRLIVFESTHRAIKLERMLLNQVEMDMIPTPRAIGASCGLSILFEEQDVEKVKAILEGESLEGIRLFRYDYKNAVEISWEE